MGTIIAYYGDIAPANYLACDGSKYDKSDYPELWTHLSTLKDTTPYIVNGDNTKFKVPDLRGEFLRGSGTNSHANQGSGSDVGEHQDATEHTIAGLNTNNNLIYSSSSKDGYYEPINQDVIRTGQADFRTAQTLGGTSSTDGIYTSRPTNTSVLFCIATKNFTMGDVSNNYSTEEQVIGTWIDGKSIYQKTFIISNPPNDTDISNLYIDNIINGFGTVKDTSAGSTDFLNFVHPEYTTQYGICFMVQNNNTILGFRSKGYTRSNLILNCTLQYTKTTD